MRASTRSVKLIESEEQFERKPLLDKHRKDDRQSQSSNEEKRKGFFSKFSAFNKKAQPKQQANHDIDEGENPKNTKDKQKKISWSIWRKLFQYTKKRKMLASLGLLLNIVYALFSSFLPLQIGKVLDQITTASKEETTNSVLNIKQGVYEVSILVALLAVFTFLRHISLQFLQQFLAMDMRNDFYRKFIENDIYFFERYKTGELVSRLSSDVNQAKSAVSNDLTYMVRSVVIIISNLIILFNISRVLTFLVMIFVPLQSLLTLQFSKRNQVLVRQYQDVQAEISALVAQKFSGIQLIKAYSTEQSEIDTYSKAITKGYHINRKKLFLTGIYNAVSQHLPYLGILIVLWYGGKMVIEGKSQLTAGALTSFILYCTSMAKSTSNIAKCYANIINGTNAIQKVFEILDYQPLVGQSIGEKIKIEGDIEFRNVTFKYPTSEIVALDNLSLKIHQGQYIAFVGESGSGKSTIIKLIERFYKIESGGIFFGPHNQDDINPICLRKQMGLVNQEASMFSGSIRSNITYGIDDYSIQDIEDAAERAGCMEFLKDQKRFPKKFDSPVGEKGGNLSGGQKQRVSIARALMRKPKIIIFDEATSALDSNSEQTVQNSIESLATINRVDKPTIIVIAHRLSTVMNADRIFVMKNGQVVEVGSHKELRALKGYYYQLIEKQLGDNPELDLSPVRPSVNIQRQ